MGLLAAGYEMLGFGKTTGRESANITTPGSTPAGRASSWGKREQSLLRLLKCWAKTLAFVTDVLMSSARISCSTGRSISQPVLPTAAYSERKT
jgi:hypothetical protein